MQILLMSISDTKNDTRLPAAISALNSLRALSKQAPFDKLVSFIDTAYEKLDSLCGEEFDNHADTDRNCSSAKPAVVNITTNLLANNADCLNAIMQELHRNITIEFANSDVFENDSRYYEQIIFESNKIPTRPNWHDFFNGLIWSQFPNTKQFFNACHMQQIELIGNAKTRTSVRDNLTHFDECGLILFTTNVSLSEELISHNWKTLFVQEASQWDGETIPVIFGHAIWEMLLNPFIGLTAKATVIEVSLGRMRELQSLMGSHAQFYAACDDLLLSHVKERQLLEIKKPWSPLPVLGIPNWSPFAQTEAFYNNTSYFMPKRK
jgi:hypothetical protein